MSKKQSSVEWLFVELFNTPKDKFEWQSIFEQAKEMHRKEIIESYLRGCLYMNLHKNDYSIFPGETSEQYYKQTFGE